MESFGRVRPGTTGEKKKNVGLVERWLSVLGGGGMVYYGLSKRTPTSIGVALLGGSLIYRGARGHCPAYGAAGISSRTEDSQETSVSQTVTVSRSPEEIYRFWRNFENLPRFMRHIESVEPRGNNRFHWVFRSPLKLFRVEWETEITEDRPGELISWKSVPGSRIENMGSVQLTRGPEDRGTEVQIQITYRPPAGDLGAALGRLFNSALALQIREDLRRSKQLLEAGEIATIEGQAAARG